MASPMVIHYISKDSHQSQQHAWVGKGRDHSFNFFGGQSKYFDMGYPLDFPRACIGLGPLFLYQMIIVITSHHCSLMTIIRIASNPFFYDDSPRTLNSGNSMHGHQRPLPPLFQKISKMSNL